MRSRSRTVRVLMIAVCTVATLMIVPATVSASSCARPEPFEIQPLEGSTLQVARVAGEKAGEPDRWEMKIDAWFCNPTPDTLTVEPLKVEHLRNGVLIETQHIPSSDGDTPALLAPNTESKLVHFRDQSQRPFPLPTQLRLTFRATGGERRDYQVIGTFTVESYGNDQPVGAFFFPARQSDLPAGHYWFQRRHAEMNNYQRWAYDFGVARWTGTGWSHLEDGTTGNSREDHLIYGEPVYSAGDGEIIGCNRGAPDNDPGEELGNVGGGNVLWVRNGDETVLYAHLMQHSIPSLLCPFDDDAEHRLADPNADPPSDAPYRIRAGQFLGLVGNSGNSTSEPHLHIHAMKGLPAIWGGSEGGMDADARPMNFVNSRAQRRLTDANLVLEDFNPIEHAIAPYNSAIEPNGCGVDPGSFVGKAQHVQLGLAIGCFSHFYNGLVHAGMRPVWIDFTDRATTNSAWRASDGTPWLLFYGLDEAGMRGVRREWVDGQGFRYLQVEAYEHDDALRYAVLLVKQPGPVQEVATGMNAAQLQSALKSREHTDFRPVAVSGTRYGASARYAALFEEAEVGSAVAKYAIPVASVQSEYDSQVRAGRHPSYADAYEMNGVNYVSMIFYSAMDSQYEIRSAGTKSPTLDRIEQNEAGGRFVRTVSSYLVGFDRHYVTIWRGEPETIITARPPAYTSELDPSFEFAAGDPLVTYECSFDAGQWHTCSSPRGYSINVDGTWTFAVRARDRQGWNESTPATASWVVDNTAPGVTMRRPAPGHAYFYDRETDTAGDDITVTGSLTVQATGFDAQSGIERIRFRVNGVSVDDAKVKRDLLTGIWSFVWSDAPPGRHSLEAVAYNRAGVRSPSGEAGRIVTVTVSRGLFLR